MDNFTLDAKMSYNHDSQLRSLPIRTPPLVVALSASSLILWVASCTSVPFTRAFPGTLGTSPSASKDNQYNLDDILKKLASDEPWPRADLPPEVISSLPPVFSLAAMTGNMAVIYDYDGHLTYYPFSLVRERRSSQFRTLRSAIKAKGLPVYDPACLPCVSCFMPDLQVEDMIESGYWNDWLRSLDRCDSLSISLDTLQQNYKDNEAAIIAGIYQIQNLQAQTTAAETSLAAVQAELASVNGKIQSLTGNSLLPDATVADSVALFKARADYNPATDFLNDGYKALPEFEDVGSRAWVESYNPSTGHGMGNTMMYSETANAVDKVIDTITNPGANWPEKAKEITESGLQPPTVNSGTRSILEQATLDSRTGGAKAAPGKSQHQTGTAVDFNLPESVNVNGQKSVPANKVAAYNLFVAICGRAGLSPPLDFDKYPAERNHFVLTPFSPTISGKPNKGYNPQAHAQLAGRVLGASSQRASARIGSLVGKNDALSRANESLVELAAKTKAIADDAVAHWNAVKSKLDSAQKQLNDAKQRLGQLLDQIDRQARQADHPHGLDGAGSRSQRNPGDGGWGLVGIEVRESHYERSEPPDSGGVLP